MRYLPKSLFSKVCSSRANGVARVDRSAPGFCRSVSIRGAFFFALLFVVCLAHGAEVMPPKPARHFNDYAKVVSSATATQLDKRLADFERETSSQLVVVVYPKMQSDSSIEDYTQRLAQSWRAGTKEKNNGAVLFVFIGDRNMFLQVGYGLEGALPDALAKRIIENEIKPHFRNGNFDAGLSAGIDAIIKATKGEYTGTGRTIGEGREGRRPGKGTPGGAIFFIIFIILLISMMRSRGTTYGPRGRRHYGGWGGGFGGFGGGGGGWSGGGGGGGFSGGGGSFGGGGAGGKW